MGEPPAVDGRRRDAIRSHLEAIAPYYTSEWDPTSPGPGTTLAALFAEMVEDVVERLDRVPEKHQMAFFDALGFDRQPPQPARVPLSMTVADGAPGNVVVDGGTRALAPAANGRPEQTFTIPDDQRFEATPANLQALYGVDPTVDRICDHWAPEPGVGLAADGDQRLFVERNQQRHVLYVGDADQLNVEQPEGNGMATIRIRLLTDADEAVVKSLNWQYYGEAPEGTEMVEKWHLFDSLASVDVAETNEVVLDLAFDGTITEREVDNVESRWIRAVQPSLHSADEVANVHIETDVRVGPGPDLADSDGDSEGADGDQGGSENGGEDGTEKKMAPNRLLYNDVPLPFDEAPSDRDIYYPFGTAPQKQSTFYVAASEAFSKSGAGLTLSFSEFELANQPPSNSDDWNSAVAKVLDTDPEQTPTDWVAEEGQPNLSWEYWDGESWSRIDGLTDNTQAFIETSDKGTVEFTVPEDLEATTVAGHENHWIRCRLVGGRYGTWVATESDDSSETHHVVFPPRFKALDILYRRTGVGDSDDEEVVEEMVMGEGDAIATEIRDAIATDEIEASALPSATASHLVTENHLSFSDLTAAGGGRVRPFRRLPDESQTLYFGFDAQLRGGPLTLFVDVDDRQFPNDFHPRVRWEYCVDPDGEWVDLDIRDGSESLTERGIIRLVLPGESAPHSLFGTERHWLRARVTGDPFETTALSGWLENIKFLISVLPRDEFPIGELPIGEFPIGDYPIGEFPIGEIPVEEFPFGEIPMEEFPIDEFSNGDYPIGEFPTPEFRSGESSRFNLDNYEFRTDGGVESIPPCGRTLETEPAAGEPTRRPPLVTDVSPNAAWAANVRLVERETLGSSDGGPSQSFSTATAPVLDETVWVDELARLSEGQRTALREAEKPGVEVETGADGAVDRFWVSWTPVADFLESGPDDRHYTVDRTAGQVTFGDGTRGRVPPRGTDNVEARYRTGGGPDGNVAAGAVEELQDTVQFVESVTNPAPGAGGAAAESSREVISRAPRRLRDRDRAVAAADYERIAMDSARGLARARCIPEMDRGGDHEPGWVTLLIVPDAPRAKPVPSTGLKAQVESAVADRAPATLVAADRLVVRGPSYVSASVDATLVAAEAGGVAALEESAADAVASFLHPLSGGEDGDGWGFGDLPTMSDLYAVLEGVNGVDHVAALSVTFAPSAGGASETTVREGQESPSISPDALVHSGTHDVTVRLGSSTEGSGGAVR